MRRWLIILFVLLLPWRLWAGDAMALAVLHSAPAGAHGPAQMATTDPAAHCGRADLIPHEAARACSPDPSHGPSHGPHLGAAHEAAPQQAALTTDPACPGLSEAGAHGLCLLCGICHQALAVPLRLGALPPALPLGAPLPARTVIVLATPQPELKPPIL
ncbi:hypothetical protein [Serpentinimonas maccroryi]|jgi:hypothetical protein|uniref:hypothetical protein n=1 Tax=Serpentinimonas maccroryi TaxID=1458426 RepID=UPI002034856F|nr:hypothetical protein [Serpentinimonas maccroryi]MCM2479060.1 hypothetical protein [Serpentinimonas maccroryi]